MSSKSDIRRHNNLQLNESELKKGFSTLKSYPVNIQFSPTERCNLSCIHCYRRKWSDTLYKDDMSLDILQTEAVKKAVSCANNTWIVSGGEIFLYEGFKSLISFLKKNNVQHLNTITNGTCITKEMIEYIVHEGFDEIKLSLDGATAKTVNYIRGKYVYERVLETVRLINIQKIRYHQTLPKLIFTMVIMKNNFKELPKLIQLAKNLNINQVEVHHLQQLNDDTQLLSMYDLPNEYDAIIRQSQNIAQKKNIILIHPPFFEKTKIESNKNIENCERCSQPWNFFLINQIGDVYPCCYLWGKPFGNIYKSSFKKIWNGKEFTNLRKDILNHTFAPTCLSSPCPKAELFNKTMGL